MIGDNHVGPPGWEVPAAEAWVDIVKRDKTKGQGDKSRKEIRIRNIYFKKNDWDILDT